MAVPNDSWITEEEVKDPSPLPKVVGWNILVRPLAIRRKTKGGIHLPDKMRDDLQHVTTVGKVLAIGPLAFQREDMFETVWVTDSLTNIRQEEKRFAPWYGVGNFVTYARYAGVKYVYKGVKLVLMQENEVHMVLESPNDIDPSYGYSV
jgi:co-chaperonin GroES (HSP10)